ncbi:hypothetical protein HED49_06740 [Ochrobactrum daejeonense]|nr:hypothetical protein [Brucella daejeonensis]
MQFPSIGGAIDPALLGREEGELIETEAWSRLKDQLLSFSDLRLVVLDPLQLLALLPLNEDPAAGQFVCASIASLAAESGANVFHASHEQGRKIDRKSGGCPRSGARHNRHR